MNQRTVPDKPLISLIPVQSPTGEAFKLQFPESLERLIAEVLDMLRRAVNCKITHIVFIVGTQTTVSGIASASDNPAGTKQLVSQCAPGQQISPASTVTDIDQPEYDIPVVVCPPAVLSGEVLKLTNTGAGRCETFLAPTIGVALDAATVVTFPMEDTTRLTLEQGSLIVAEYPDDKNNPQVHVFVNSDSMTLEVVPVKATKNGERYTVTYYPKDPYCQVYCVFGEVALKIPYLAELYSVREKEAPVLVPMDYDPVSTTQVGGSGGMSGNQGESPEPPFACTIDIPHSERDSSKLARNAIMGITAFMSLMRRRRKK